MFTLQSQKIESDMNTTRNETDEAMNGNGEGKEFFKSV
jgi:hypothetical protein